MRGRYARLAVAIALAAGALLPALPASADAPSNDDFDTPIHVTSLPFEYGMDTTGATRGPDDPAVDQIDCYDLGDRTVWFAFTTKEDVRVAATTAGSDYTTVLAAFTGTRGNLTQVACNIFASSGPGSRIRFDADAGTTYYLAVGAAPGDETGRRLVFGLAASPEPLLEVALTASDRAAFDGRTGGAWVSGTVACSKPAMVGLDGVLMQGGVSSYVFPEPLECSPEPRAWRALSREGGRLVPGTAQLLLRAYAWDDLDRAYDEVRQAVVVTVRR